MFTRLDETSTFGPLWAESVRQSKPISFLSNGPGIPENLQEATVQLTAGLILGGLADSERESAERLEERGFETPAARGQQTAPALSGNPGNAAAAA
jgi:hypothetical protein